MSYENIDDIYGHYWHWCVCGRRIEYGQSNCHVKCPKCGGTKKFNDGFRYCEKCVKRTPNVNKKIQKIRTK